MNSFFIVYCDVFPLTNMNINYIQSSMRNFLLSFILLMPFSVFAQLVINEISQGESGSKEYVELVVIGDNTGCSTDSVDIRGWIIDDNNGWHAAGSGNGIAQGHMRFANIPQWEKVPVGALIVIYNHNDVNPLLPPADPDDTLPNNCVYVVPGNSNTLERNTSIPVVNGNMGYGGPYTAGGNWTTTGMANADDTYQIIDPANLTTWYHAVSWGSNHDASANPGKITFAGSAAGDVIYMSNASSNDPFDQTNWTNISINNGDGSQANDETPGFGNSVANSLWIDTLRNGCMPFLPASTPMDDEICEGESSTLTASGGGTYEWSDMSTNANLTVTPAADQTYTVTVSSNYGCTTSIEIPVIVHPNPIPEIIGDTILCSNVNALTLDAGAYSGYDWDPNGEMTQTIMVSAIGDYTVTVTDANNCTGTADITIEPVDLFFIRE